MVTGGRNKRLMVATGTRDQHLGARLCAAALDGRERPQVLKRELVTIVGQEVGLEGFDDASQADHLTFPRQG